MKPVIGITMGDPTGIGPEIILKALAGESIRRLCYPVIFGDYKYFLKVENFLRRKGCLKGKITFSPRPCFNSIGHQINQIRGSAIPFYDLANIPKKQKLTFGKPTAWGGRASGAFIREAVKAALNGAIDGLVTAPINKLAFKMGGWGKKFAGHTEMLGSLTGTKDFALMMILGPFRVIHVTSHVPLDQVKFLIKKKRIEKTIELANQGVKALGIASPKIAVSGLNPHAGENGILGREELDEISPAIISSRKKGLRVKGPFPPDIIWPLVLNGAYDIGVAMYHEQGQIPLKILSFRTNSENLEPGKLVNITVGIPIIRTSVGHGTAYDIAGKGLADDSSLREAIKVACQLAGQMVMQKKC